MTASTITATVEASANSIARALSERTRERKAAARVLPA